MDFDIRHRHDAENTIKTRDIIVMPSADVEPKCILSTF